MDEKNKYGVSEKLWRALNGNIYNRVMDGMLNNQGLFIHPEAPMLRNEHWKTICHSAAVIAALK